MCGVYIFSPKENGTFHIEIRVLYAARTACDCLPGSSAPRTDSGISVDTSAYVLGFISNTLKYIMLNNFTLCTQTEMICYCYHGEEFEQLD